MWIIFYLKNMSQKIWGQRWYVCNCISPQIMPISKSRARWEAGGRMSRASSSSSSPEPPEPMDLEESQDSVVGGLEEAVREAVGGQTEGEAAVDVRAIARQFAEYLVVDSKQDVSKPFLQCSTRILQANFPIHSSILALFCDIATERFIAETTVGRPHRGCRVPCRGVQKPTGARAAQHDLQCREGGRPPQLHTATQGPLCPCGPSCSM